LEKGQVRFHFLQQGVKDLLKNPELVASYPKMDFIYSAGLFDYLHLSVAQKLTNVLLDMLSPDGLLTIGNFNRYENDFFIGYASDWFLILRGPEEILQFLPDDSWRSRAVIEREKTGSNLFLNVRKNAPY
jgi:hypothetical protein